MHDSNIAISVENISKCYRLGVKEDLHDTFANTVLDCIKSPLKNFRKYQSLYNFDDIHPDQDYFPSDIIWALRDISFKVEKGEVVGIIGVNGAGKSTLLKILSKITAPTSGRATIRGRISSLLEVGTGFHPELTGRENIYLNGTILGMRKKEIDDNFDEIVDFSGIEKFIDTPVKRYSSGMRVRLAFAVAAYLEPEILIIDEVLAVGDARFQKKCLDKMNDFGQHGRTVIFVSHNMPAVTRLCPRTILLNGGQVMEDGPSHKIVGAYMNADKGVQAEHSWYDLMEAPGDEVVRLCSVRVRNQDGQIKEAVDIRQPVSIEMEYEVLQSGHEVRVYFHVMNEEGILAFTSVDHDPTWKNKPRQIGRYASAAWIPGDLLSEGMYFIRPRIDTLDPQIRRVIINDVVAIHVVDNMNGNGARGDVAGRLKGVVRPLLKWETQYKKNGNYVAKKC